MKTCAAASEYIFYVSANVWLLLGKFQCFLKNVRLLLKDINERLLLKRKCAADMFLCVWLFLHERAAASEKILTTASEIFKRKKCATAF